MTKSRAQNILAGLGLSLLSLVFCLVVLEIGFRVFEASRHPSTVATDRPLFYYGPPGALDVKDTPHLDSKPPGVFRIAVVGDSFTFGPMLQYDDTFPKRLERILNARAKGPRVEVYNYGVPGLATVQELEVLKQVVRQKPDLVVLEITLNDVEPQPFFANARGNSVFGPFNPTGFEKTLTAHWHSLRFVLERLHNELSHQAHTRYYFKIFDKPGNLGMFASSLEKMRDRLTSRQIPLAAIIFPMMGYSFESGKYPFAPLHQQISEQLKELGIPTLDLLETFRGLDTYRLEILPGVDAHPNELAHRRVAEQLYLWLLETHKIPANLAIDFKYDARLH